LGEKTSSGDTETPVCENKEIPPLEAKEVSAVLQSFLGEGKQIPPMASAIKVEGVPLYKKAHEGVEIPREPRTVCIFSINLVSLAKDNLVFTCTVSRGTYIRVLGEDIAKKLSTLGHLVSLRRLSIGPFLVDQAKKIGALSESDVVDPTVFITVMKHVEIDEGWLDKVKNGQALTLEQDYGEKALLVLHGEALAVYRRVNTVFYVSERGLF